MDAQKFAAALNDLLFGLGNFENTDRRHDDRRGGERRAAERRAERSQEGMDVLNAAVRHTHVSPRTGAILVTLQDGVEFEVTVRRVLPETL